MDDKTLIAKRVAMELRPGYLVNLGIGLPTLVASLVPRDANIYFASLEFSVGGFDGIRRGIGVKGGRSPAKRTTTRK